MGGFVCTRVPKRALRQCQLQLTHSADLAATRHLLVDSLSRRYKSLRKEAAGLILLAEYHVASVDWLIVNVCVHVRLHMHLCEMCNQF